MWTFAPRAYYNKRAVAPTHEHAAIRKNALATDDVLNGQQWKPNYSSFVRIRYVFVPFLYHTHTYHMFVVARDPSRWALQRAAAALRCRKRSLDAHVYLNRVLYIHTSIYNRGHRNSKRINFVETLITQTPKTDYIARTRIKWFFI